MAKKKVQPPTEQEDQPEGELDIGTVEQQIADKEAQIVQLQGEIADLREAAAKPLLALAARLGYTLTSTRQPSTRRAGGASTGPKTDPEQIAGWLRETLKDGPMKESELREEFGKSGLGKRLRLDKYVKEGVVKVNEKTEEVSLV